MYLPNEYSQQRQREKKAKIYPVLLAMQAEYYRKQGHQVWWGEVPEEMLIDGMVMDVDKVICSPETLSLTMLPRPDRIWTKAKEYTSGNYKYLPGTHIMSALGCWWGKCTFCVEHWKKPCQGMYGQPGVQEVRPVEDVISEIEECKSLGFKEVFDDSATFPYTGERLCAFLAKLRNCDIKFSCNCRIGVPYPFADMHKCGFRMLLFGIESANQETLDKINKGVKSEDIIPTLKRASEAGLSCHGAFMFGYPWETDEDAVRTLKLCHYLLRKGYLATAQASLYSPQGVPGNQAHKKYVKKIYNAGWYPDFWWNKLRSVRDTADLKYIWRGIKSAMSS